MSRRRFLTLAGIAGVGLCTCGGLGAWGLSSPRAAFSQPSCGGEGTLGEWVLIAYASKCGSTAEVAEAIGQTLCAAGAAVDVRRVQEVRDLTPYRAVVVGTAIRMGEPLGEAVSFAKKHQAALAGLPTAVFSLGTAMIHDTPENRATAAGYLQPLTELVRPVSTGLFAGKVDPAKMEPIWRFMMSFVKEGEMAPGDHRDWDAIRAWATELNAALAGA